MTNAKVRRGVSKAQWLESALSHLLDHSVADISVEKLAKNLGISRAGFYWHFRDRDALLEALIQRWEAKNTGNLVARTEAFAENICEAMFNLCDCWLDDALFDSRLDLAIRNWAMSLWLSRHVSEKLPSRKSHQSNTFFI